MSLGSATAEVVGDCDLAAEELAGACDGSLGLTDATRAHVEQCLRCQVEGLRLRRVRRELIALREHTDAPHPEAWIEVVEAIEAAVARARRRTAAVAACAGGLAAVSAAALSRRHHRMAG